MADIIIRNVPAKIAEKFDKAKEVSYQQFVDQVGIEEKFSITFNPPIDAKKLLEELDQYNG